MTVQCDIIVDGSTVVFECSDALIGSEPQTLRETLESQMDLAAISDGDCIGTATFPTVADGGGNTSFTISDEYTQHGMLF